MPVNACACISEETLIVRNVSRSFGSKRVLNDVSFSLKEGTVTGLIGPSGGGKSVLLKIVGGVLEPTHGVIERNLDDKCDVSLMFQEGALFDSINVFDNVAFPLVAGKVPTNLLRESQREKVIKRVSEILARVGLSNAATKMPEQLSGGMRRRVSLARALVNKPQLVLLDDPTCGLDPVASTIIMNLIIELHKEYMPTTLIVSQDLRRLLPVVDCIIVLLDGSVRFHGTLEELRHQADDEIRRFVSGRFEL